MPGLELTKERVAGLHELYRHLHAHPELSMQEHATAQLILDRLGGLGIDAWRCGGTGVVGVIENGPGAVIALRADTDGLPLQELSGVEYASRATGTLPNGETVPVMHACGHDTHVAALLTAAEILASSKDSWAGTVVLIFQPGEEIAAGARAMLADGLWERAPKPEVVFGQHVGPYAAGTIAMAAGPAMAMADSWKVTVRGSGGHGSQPHLTIDPIVLAAHMIVRIQTIVSREIDPIASAVVTVGRIAGGLKENIIPESCEFTLNVRTFDDAVRDTVLGSLRRILAAEADASGAPAPSIEELSTFPRCVNDPEEVAWLMELFAERFGEERVSTLAPLMGSEDFGLHAEAIGVPSVLWMFGGYGPERLAGREMGDPNHSPHFAPDLSPTLETATEALLEIVRARLPR